MHKELLDIHQMEDYCIELKSKHVKCALCHEQIEDSVNGSWKHHLTTACAGTAKRRSRI